MNLKSLRRACLFIVSLLVIGLTPKLSAQGTAFSYQGHLETNGVAVTGQYDFTFTLFNAATGGSAVSLTQTNFSVPVNNGLFTTNLNFGAVFNGSTNFWLSIGVTTNNGTVFTPLTPRQQLLAVPYAIFAGSASNLAGPLAATQISGALPSAQITGTYTGTVAFTNSTNSFTGTYYGNGANLTNLNATSIASGTLADIRLSGNVPLLNANNQFSGANSFTNRSNAFTGSFFGNGLVGWIPVLGTSTQAVPNTAYLLLNPNLTTVTLPPTSSLFTGDVVRVASPYNGGWQLAQNAGQSITGVFFNPTNASWLPATAAGVAWRDLASSSDGSKMVGVSVGTSGSSGIYISTDHGTSWNLSYNAVSATTVASSSDGSRLVAANAGGTIILSTNSGTSWFTVMPSVAQWSGVTMSSDGSKFSVSIFGGAIFTWSNYGATSNFYNGAAYWTCIAGSSDNSHLAACITNGGIYTSVNGGTSFSQSAFPNAAWNSIACSSDGTKIAATTVNGHIYTSIDGGASYTLQAGSPSTNWSSIVSSSDGSRLAATVTGGGIYVSGNFGVTWVKQSISNQTWYGITGSQDLNTMAAASYDAVNGGRIYYWSPSVQSTTSTTGTAGSLTGSAGSAVELIYIGNNQFMPISSAGTFWSN